MSKRKLNSHIGKLFCVQLTIGPTIILGIKGLPEDKRWKRFVILCSNNLYIPYAGVHILISTRCLNTLDEYVGDPYAFMDGENGRCSKQLLATRPPWKNKTMAQETYTLYFLDSLVAFKTAIRFFRHNPWFKHREDKTIKYKACSKWLRVPNVIQRPSMPQWINCLNHQPQN